MGKIVEAISVERQIGKSTLRFETGKLAKQAAGAVLVRYADTTVLTASAVGAPRGDGDFFPLTVDYRERTYAAGIFPGGFRKREGAPSVKEILTMRLTDRPIRPLFPHHYTNEVQIQSTVLSTDRQNEPDVHSINGASASLYVSDMPFRGPIGAVRVGRINGEFVVFPTIAELATSDLDLVVAATAESVCMIEGFGNEIPEDVMGDAIQFAFEQIQHIIAMQQELRAKVGKPVLEPEVVEADPLIGQLRERYLAALKEAKVTEGKLARAEKVAQIKARIQTEMVGGEGGPTPAQIGNAFHQLEEMAVRELILDGQRLDGRSTKAIRALHSEVGVLPRVHGSSLFQRGETQALMVATLGSVADAQKVEGITENYAKRFMLDYNFPPFCVGEVKPIRGPGRREIGHGMLAERSLKPILPSETKFPYTIRLVSEILESNGSSSMASVCAGTLTLMDAGVPIKNPVAGISIGLVLENNRHTLLTDIMGDEDHFGDMDFKVAGTQNGITGIQLDLKIAGISEQIIRETLVQAREARIEILKHMLRTIKRPNREISDYAPRLVSMKIPKDKIGMIIGPGGRNIRALQEDTQTTVNIEDDGTVTIAGLNKAGVEEAYHRIEAVTEDVTVGRVYRGRVSSITDFGAFVEIVPGRDGLVHISELDHGYVGKVSDVVKVGETLEVKVIAIDDHDRVKLSRKAILPAPKKD